MLLTDRGHACQVLLAAKRHKRMVPASWKGATMIIGSLNTWLTRAVFNRRRLFSRLLSLSFNRAVNQVLGDWQLNTIITVQSGFPYYVTVPGDSCNCGASTQTVNQVGTRSPGLRRHSGQWFNTSAFTLPQAALSERAAETSCPGPGKTLWMPPCSKSFR
jgi:hypothetical protein